MAAVVSLEKVYVPSEDIVAREIEGQIIIVPLVRGIADMEEELFTLNETGKAIWQRLDGARTLGDVVKELIEEFEGAEIGSDVLGFVEELMNRRILVEAR